MHEELKERRNDLYCAFSFMSCTCRSSTTTVPWLLATAVVNLCVTSCRILLILFCIFCFRTRSLARFREFRWDLAKARCALRNFTSSLPSDAGASSTVPSETVARCEMPTSIPTMEAGLEQGGLGSPAVSTCTETCH